MKAHKYTKRRRGGMHDARVRIQVYHAFEHGTAGGNAFGETLCGVWLREVDNKLTWPWCEECHQQLEADRVPTRLVKVIDSRYHLPQNLARLRESDFVAGKWRQTACGKLVQFGKQSKHNSVCAECSAALAVSQKKVGKIRELVGNMSKGKKRKGGTVTRIPEVTFAPTEAILARIRREEIVQRSPNGINA